MVCYKAKGYIFMSLMSFLLSAANAIGLLRGKLVKFFVAGDIIWV